MDAAAIIQVDGSMLDKCARSASHASENADRTTDNRTYSPSAWAITTSRFIGSKKGDDYLRCDGIVVEPKAFHRANRGQV